MKSIAAALLKVQQGLDPVHKGRKGYGYNYADLPAVMDACLDALNAAGVVVIQAPVPTDKQAAAVHTRLIHADSGEEITSTIEVPYGDAGKMSAAQVYGSAITYARRYAIVSMLGIVTEEDDGASTGQRPQRVEPKPTPKVDQAAAAAEAWAKGYVERRKQAVAAFTADAADMDTENSGPIARAAAYPAARKVLEDAGVVV